MNAATGIYLNRETKRIVRVQAMPAGPTGVGWIKVTDNANAGLKTIRDMARAQGLVAEPEAIQWDIDLEAIKKMVGTRIIEWPEEAAA